MELTWNGKDITNAVNITGCVHRDVSLGRCDSLELTLDHASRWYSWNPEEDDEIIITSGGYSTGRMYLNTIIPDGDQYRILATSLKRAASRRAWASYTNTTLQGIVDKCAAECGMEGKLYGIDGGLKYPYILRQNEGAAAFLNRIGQWEGLAVKALNGALRGVSVALAQERNAEASIEITSKQDGVTYRRRDNTKYSMLTVQTPYGKATARDAEAKGNNSTILTHLPAMDNAQAGRWARGMILMHNRQAEEMTLETALNLRLVAMTRVDVTGSTAMAGKWIVDESEHDLFNERSCVKFLRVIDSVK